MLDLANWPPVHTGSDCETAGGPGLTDVSFPILLYLMLLSIQVLMNKCLVYIYGFGILALIAIKLMGDDHCSSVVVLEAQFTSPCPCPRTTSQGKDGHLYSERPIVRNLPLKRFHTANTPHLPLPRKAFTRGRHQNTDSGHLIAAYYSFIDPEG